ncbi:hypothetical protein PHLH6_24090 [Pseudomonas sp. Seg1]|uniref:hypothetical protein n=1 Tax=unclassified Pseudomonas TaxID=196821 RepID=UPI001BB43607|nr:MULTISPECIES: hypothetical protein [unclassified Pseudomonas]BBP70405.1 hypothetical protein PHLH6_24090 [Pseudomonas sp. Seg1]
MTRVIEMDAVSKAIAVSELFSVVLLDRLGQEALYGSKECSSNIFLVDNVGNVVWQVSSDFDSDGGAFTHIFVEGGQLKAYRWDGGSYNLDFQTGRAVPSQLLK